MNKEIRQSKHCMKLYLVSFLLLTFFLGRFETANALPTLSAPPADPVYVSIDARMYVAAFGETIDIELLPRMHSKVNFNPAYDYKVAQEYVTISSSLGTPADKVKIVDQKLRYTSHMNGDDVITIVTDIYDNSTQAQIIVKVYVEVRKLPDPQNDYASTLIDVPVTVDAMLNDDLGVCQKSSIGLTINSVTNMVGIPDVAGTAEIVGTLADRKIKFTPAEGFSGIAIIDYSLDCQGMRDPEENFPSAKIYIYVYKINDYYACEGEEVEVNIGAGIRAKWYESSTATEPFYTGYFVTVVKNGDPEQEVWAAVTTILDDVSVTFDRQKVVIKLVPSLMYWSTTAEDHNWNNPNNWVDFYGNPVNVIPHSCTSVHIPGTADKYPSLDDTNTPRHWEFYNEGNPVCDNIIYHFGAEVAKPHRLTYNRAYVHYNFAHSGGSNLDVNGSGTMLSNTMSRDRYYALSAPLNSMYTGDFSMGGFPNMWQRAFKTAEGACKCGELDGEWYSPSNKMALPLDGSMNYAVSLKANSAGSEWGKTQEGLDELNGIITIPYFEDETGGWDADPHRLHKYESGESQFRYYYTNKAGYPLVPAEAPYLDIVPRSGEAYRFIFEGSDSFEMTIPITDGDNDGDTDWIMVGNPFLSSLDFDVFYADNSAYIEDYYNLFTGSSFPTTYVSSSERKIASFQAFFVKPKGSVGSSITLRFTEDMSVLRDDGASHQLRSAIPGKTLRMTVTNAVGSSWADLVFDFNHDIERLFSKDNSKVPQIYTRSLEAGRKNIVQYVRNNPQRVIPVGIRGGQFGPYTLSFDNVESLSFQMLVLFDKKLNRIVDIERTPTYTFEHTDGDLSDRFELSFNRVPSGIEELDATTTQVYVANRILNVLSEEKINSVQVANLQGVSVLNDNHVNGSEFRKTLPFTTGVYIVKVRLENGKTKIEKVVIK